VSKTLPVWYNREQKDSKYVFDAVVEIADQNKQRSSIEVLWL